MATQHHGSDENKKAMQRFIGEMNGETPREYPNGRLSADDDGAFAYLIAADPKKGVIQIKFPHPTDWIGLDYDSAEKLRDALSEKMLELRGITV